MTWGLGRGDITLTFLSMFHTGGLNVFSLPFMPQKRLIDVREIADYALFLASSNAKGVSGQSVVIDDGYTVQ